MGVGAYYILAAHTGYLAQLVQEAEIRQAKRLLHVQPAHLISFSPYLRLCRSDGHP